MRKGKSFRKRVRRGDLVLPESVTMTERKKIGDLSEFEEGISLRSSVTDQLDFMDQMLRIRFGLSKDAIFMTKGHNSWGGLTPEYSELCKVVTVFIHLNGYTSIQIFKGLCFKDPTNNWFLNTFPDIELKDLYNISAVTSPNCKRYLYPHKQDSSSKLYYRST